MAKRPFKPLETAKINLAEMNSGKVIPTAPVAYGLMMGTPTSILVIEVLEEIGVGVGPKTASLIGIVLSALFGYFTRGGRRLPNFGSK